MTVADVERIGAPEISRMEARRAYLDYKRAVLSAANPAERHEYEGLWRGYKAIAAGQQVIDLDKTMAAAGVQEDTLYPRLAICRADARTCRVDMSGNGSASFADAGMRWRSRVAKGRRVSLPPGTFPQFNGRWHEGIWSRYRPSGALERANWTSSATALVPIVPPRLHPRAALTNYLILWDAVWTPAPPRDPLLLRHLAGALYAIVAQWDLTPLEQAVLRGRL